MKATTLDLPQRIVGEVVKIRRTTIRVDPAYQLCAGCRFYKPGKCIISDADRKILGECDEVIFVKITQ